MKKIIIIILMLLCQSVPVNAVDNSLEILYKDKNSDYSSPTVESLSEKHLEANEPFVDNELSMDSTEPIASIGEDETDKDIATLEKEYESTIKATENSSEEPISDGTERNQNIESYASTFKWGTSTVSVNGDSATVGSGQLSGAYPKELYNVKHLTLASGVKFPAKSNSLFAYTGVGEGDVLLEDIIGLERVDTSNVTNMNRMFFATKKLKSLDVSKFNTSNVTDMAYMFYGLDLVTNLNVSKFNTSNVTDMSYMFYTLESLTDLNVSNFKTSNVTDMSYMFRGLKELTEIKGLEKLDTSKVANMKNMFATSWNIKSFDLSSFDTRKVTSMSSMFQNNSRIKSLKIGQNTKLKDNIKLSVSKGTGYSSNWTLKGSASGKISLSDKEMGSDKPSNNPGEYVWEEKQPDVYGYIEVYYEEEKEYGKKLLPITKIEGIVGQPYDVRKEKDREFEGYTLISDPKNMTGVFKTFGQTIHFLYKKNESIRIEVPDKINITSKELILNAPLEPGVITERTRISDEALASLITTKGVKGYISSGGKETEIPLKDFKLEYDGLANVPYKPSDTPVTVKVKGSYKDLSTDWEEIRINVSDGRLQLNAPGELLFKSKLSSKLTNQTELSSRIDLIVRDDRYAEDGWQINATASEFITEDGKNTVIPVTDMDLMARIGGQDGQSLITNGGVNLENTTDKNKQYDLSNKNSGVSLYLTTKKSQGWAKTDWTYTTTINWDLNSSIKIPEAQFLVPKPKKGAD